MKIIKEYCSSDLDFENIEYHNESADLYIEDSQNSIYVNDNLNYGISGTSDATASDENKKIVRCRKKIMSEATATKMVIWNCNLEGIEGISINMQIEIMLSDNNSKKQIIVYMNADKYGVYFNQ